MMMSKVTVDCFVRNEIILNDYKISLLCIIIYKNISLSNLKSLVTLTCLERYLKKLGSVLG